ncbi:hypothetical protein KI387_022172, partial [Taxus chinensis]
DNVGKEKNNHAKEQVVSSSEIETREEGDLEKVSASLHEELEQLFEEQEKRDKEKADAKA